MLNRLASQVIPVVRTDSQASAELAVGWLRDAGISTFEITLTTPGAVDSIAMLSADSRLLVGAGTVMSAADVEAVVAAGAQFVVSPVLHADVIRRCAELGVTSICGALTPSEIALAWEYGADAVKIFPVNSVGGAVYIKSVRDVFPDVRFIPTGGIKVAQIACNKVADLGVLYHHSFGLPCGARGINDVSKVCSVFRLYVLPTSGMLIWLVAPPPIHIEGGDI